MITEQEADLHRTIDRLTEENRQLRAQVARKGGLPQLSPPNGDQPPTTLEQFAARGVAAQRAVDAATLPPGGDAYYEAIKARLIAELPSDPRIMELVLSRPELRVRVERSIVTIDGTSLRGKLARLIADDYFGRARTMTDVLNELERRGRRPSNIELTNELKALTEMGFFTRDNKWYSLVPSMKVQVVEAD